MKITFMDWQDDKQKQPAEESFTNELLKGQLNFANNWKIHEDYLNWSIFGFFLAANVLLLVPFFNNNTSPFKLGFIIIGFFLSLVWLVIQNHAVNSREFYVDLVFQLEEKLKIPKEFKTIKFTNWMKYLPFVGIFVWVVVSIFFVLNPETVTKMVTIQCP
jgi:hypothetical protein